MPTLSLEEFKTNVGDNVATARSAIDWTQQVLADEADLSRPTIGKIESHNATEISVSTLLKLANALGIPPFLLLLGKRDWERLVALTGIVEKINNSRAARASSLPAVSKEDQAKLVRDILIPPEPQQPDAVETVEREIRKPLCISAALGTKMLPGHPILNALIAAIIAIPAEDFISRETKE